MRRAILLLLAVAGLVLLLTADRDRGSRPDVRPDEPVDAPEVEAPVEPGEAPTEEPSKDRGPAPATDGVLRGRVLDPNGAPVSGGVVRIHTGPTVRVEHGSYRIEGLSPGPKLVLAAAPGFHPIPAAVEIPVAGETVLDLRFEREGLPVAGRVVDKNDDPIAGARIRVWPKSADWGLLWRLEHPPTGSDGAFRITGLPDCPVRVTVEARFFRVSRQEVHAGRTDLLFRLDAAGEIAGRFVPPAGVDPKDPRIQIQFEAETASGTDSDWFTSDPLDKVTDGLNYRLAGLEPGVYVVRVRVFDVGHGEAREIRVHAGKVTEVDIPLTEGGVLTGLVLDPDGRPIADAYVVASEEENLPAGLLLDEGDAFLNEGVDTRTDEHGRYRIVGLASGVYGVAAKAAGYRYGQVTALPVPETKEVGAIHLGAGASILVTAPEEVGAWIFIGTADEASLDGKIGADGRCRIDSIPEGIHQMQFSGKAWTSHFEVEVTAGMTTEITVVRPSGGAALSGRVTRAGEGVVDRGLSLIVYGADGRTVTYRARTDREGRYRFAGALEGRGSLMVRQEGVPWHGMGSPSPVTLKAGDNWLDVELPVTAIRLRIVDARTGVGLRAIILRNGRMAGRSGADGRVALTEVEAGKSKLIVEADGHAPTRLTATASEDPEEVRVALEAATTIEIEVRDEKGEPVSLPLVSIVDAYGWNLAGYANDWRFSDERTGRQQFRLGRGTYRLTVSENGFESVTREITMPWSDGVLKIVLVRK